MAEFKTLGGSTTLTLWGALQDTGKKSGVKFSKYPSVPTAEQVAKDWDGAGKVVIITGAYAGLGKEASRVLAMRGAEVVVAGRSKTKADAAIAEVKEADPDAKLRFLELDLSSQASVKRFADAFHATGLPLNVLVNNAGVMGCPFGLSSDGYEMHFATNHLGHFLLTRLLLPDLEAAAKASGTQSRVVTVSSSGHHALYPEGLRFDDLPKPSEKGYNETDAYGQSKLANILFTRELDSRLKDRKSSVVAVCCHPGVVPTELIRHLPVPQLFAPIVFFIFRLILAGYRVPPKGASSEVYLATAPEVDGGEYYMDCAVMPTSKYALDKEMALKLWDMSEDMCKDYVEKWSTS